MTEPVHKGVHKHPKKKFFRARAHSNPLNDQSIPCPLHPGEVDWSDHFSASSLETASRAGDGTPIVHFVDVGCGFGGLLVQLSPLFPEELIIGIELRDKVTHYVRERIQALRRETPGRFGNISAIRANAQKHLVNYFSKGQLTKLFFLFPDPHFKATNHRRRIIQDSLLAEYAYCLACGGTLYTVTDVPDLGRWMQARLDKHPLFERIAEEELRGDLAYPLLTKATEEGQKVARNSGETWCSAYRRVRDSRNTDGVEDGVD